MVICYGGKGGGVKIIFEYLIGGNVFILDHFEGIKITFSHFLRKPAPLPCDAINNRSARESFAFTN